MPLPAIAAGGALAAPLLGGAGKGAGTAALTSGALAAGGGLAQGLAQGLMTPDPQKPQEGKLSYGGGSPGQVGARAGGGQLFSGRQDIARPNRASLASELLRRGGYS